MIGYSPANARGIGGFDVRRALPADKEEMEPDFAHCNEDWKAGDWENGSFTLPAGDDAAFISIRPELDL